MPLSLPTVLAQATRPRQVTVPESFIIEAEKVAAERDHLRVTVGLKDEQIAALKDQIGALNGLAQIQTERAEALLKAAQERSAALLVDDKRIALYEADVTRLRSERDKARAGQKWFGAVGLILGAALGYYGTRR